MSRPYPYFATPDGLRGYRGLLNAMEVLDCDKIGSFVRVVSPDRRMIVRRIGVEEQVWSEEDRAMGLDRL